MIGRKSGSGYPEVKMGYYCRFYSTYRSGGIGQRSTGFIVFVVPHMMRGVAGSAHRRLIPLALLGGGLFAVIADFLSRVLIAPEELPVWE